MTLCLPQHTHIWLISSKIQWFFYAISFHFDIISGPLCARKNSNWRTVKSRLCTNLIDLSFLWLNQNFLLLDPKFLSSPSICVTKYVAKNNIQRSQIYQYWLESSFHNNNVISIFLKKKSDFRLNVLISTRSACPDYSSTMLLGSEASEANRPASGWQICS